MSSYPELALFSCQKDVPFCWESSGASVEYLSSRGSWIPAKVANKTAPNCAFEFFLRGFCPVLFCFCDFLVDLTLKLVSLYFCKKKTHILRMRPSKLFMPCFRYFFLSEMQQKCIGLVCNVISFPILSAPT